MHQSIPAVPNMLFLPAKFSVYLYSDRKPHACQKLGNSPGVGKCRPRGRAEFANAPPLRADMAGNAPAIAQWGGGGNLCTAGID